MAPTPVFDDEVDETPKAAVDADDGFEKASTNEDFTAVNSATNEEVETGLLYGMTGDDLAIHTNSSASFSSLSSLTPAAISTTATSFHTTESAEEQEPHVVLSRAETDHTTISESQDTDLHGSPPKKPTISIIDGHSPRSPSFAGRNRSPPPPTPRQSIIKRPFLALRALSSQNVKTLQPSSPLIPAQLKRPGLASRTNSTTSFKKAVCSVEGLLGRNSTSAVTTAELENYFGSMTPLVSNPGSPKMPAEDSAVSFDLDAVNRALEEFKTDPSDQKKLASMTEMADKLKRSPDTVKELVTRAATARDRSDHDACYETCLQLTRTPDLDVLIQVFIYNMMSTQAPNVNRALELITISEKLTSKHLADHPDFKIFNARTKKLRGDAGQRYHNARKVESGSESLRPTLGRAMSAKSEVHAPVDGVSIEKRMGKFLGSREQ
ncbi:hypothetical protein LTR91_019384 [Friedmanniomyces endolithicus]|uniref:Uncharacterized protein n=1 Tax=Friedmanniomyces endolithicus TaxID=329885 RepID=A0A4U0UWT3_9PEZI|nr:hypothetical protein LTS09_007500 [Friedmanniomyces endolithicus]KAK0775275.1 hypothetical protein LTR59_014577 [Friedmanniomyces endolithicus]KAK0792922.1 hypothetical protein LTR75_011330 [Friedmanniomyces endolithicus]KAK0794438.1 hypothetical protein LTR38_009199 [Friedmanniomyces endolithicus]KAK0856584.1 hypothetical protein LTS02_010572 [Friedmanniomyces endolithicus]